MTQQLAQVTYQYSLDTIFGTITLSCSKQHVLHIHIHSNELDSNHYDAKYRKTMAKYQDAINTVSDCQTIPDIKLQGEINKFKRELASYCKGDINQFSQEYWLENLQISSWQKTVMQAMRTIQPGGTLTYGAVSILITGSSKSSRAVGLACASNPLPLIYPCHRVIGHNGKMTGFGFGIANKLKLLNLESKNEIFNAI